MECDAGYNRGGSKQSVRRRGGVQFGEDSLDNKYERSVDAYGKEVTIWRG